MSYFESAGSTRRYRDSTYDIRHTTYETTSPRRHSHAHGVIPLVDVHRCPRDPGTERATKKPPDVPASSGRALGVGRGFVGAIHPHLPDDAFSARRPRREGSRRDRVDANAV